MSDRLWKVLAGLVLVGTLGVRLYRIDQPITENYVGRQVPTAMVARNLDRGGSFFRPVLDTAPWPNYFVVEPPVYEAVVVGVRRVSGLSLEQAGRAVSAGGMVLAGWAILVVCAEMGKRERGLAAALMFSILPVTIRYGRAFQPDALAVGLVLAGCAGWIRGENQNLGRWRVLGWGFLSLGLAVKVLGVFALGVLVWEQMGRGKPLSVRKLAALGLTVVPAVAWYGYAATLLGSGSRASRDNAGLWLEVLIPSAWGERKTYQALGRYFLVRAFTPVALGLAVVGWWRGELGRFWRGWCLGSLGILALLVAKLHHEYYWLWLAPGVAVGAGWVLAEWVPRLGTVVGRALPARVLLWVALMGMSGWLTRSTWETPGEWRGLERSAQAIDAHVPRGGGLVAREAVLYAADRKGYRLETGAEAVRRAAGEWGERWPEEKATPESLVRWYHEQGAQYLADVGDPGEGRRSGWVEGFRRPPHRVLVDRDGLFLVKLFGDEDGRDE